MRLATLRTDSPNADGSAGTVAVRIDGQVVTELKGAADVGALLAHADWREWAAAATGTQHDLGSIAPQRWAPVVPRPGKIFCVGMNYKAHIAEMGRPAPEYPTLFAKFTESLVGPYDPIELPAVSRSVDWEAELAIVIGAPARNISEAEVPSVIAGYTIMNDISVRDYQNRTMQFLQGKTFENSTPLGPELVTTDEWTPGGGIRSIVSGEVMQDGSTSDLVFGPEMLVSYISQIITLKPGDIIATGTPGGVGHARTPARYLADGETVVIEIDGLGAQRNVTVQL